jgi:hypothetical protein
MSGHILPLLEFLAHGAPFASYFIIELPFDAFFQLPFNLASTLQ